MLLHINTNSMDNIIVLSFSSSLLVGLNHSRNVCSSDGLRTSCEQNANDDSMFRKRIHTTNFKWQRRVHTPCIERTERVSYVVVFVNRVLLMLLRKATTPKQQLLSDWYEILIQHFAKVCLMSQVVRQLIGTKTERRARLPMRASCATQTKWDATWFNVILLYSLFLIAFHFWI